MWSSRTKGDCALSIVELTEGFAPGSKVCVRTGNPRYRHSIQRHIERLANAKQKTVSVAHYATWGTRFSKWWHRDSSVAWLSTAGGISQSDAETRINSSPLSIRPRLSTNGSDPRKLIGIMAVVDLADVLLYNTIGNSQVGAETIHSYVAEAFAHGCAIHLALPESGDNDHSYLPGAIIIDADQDE